MIIAQGEVKLSVESLSSAF